MEQLQSDLNKVNLNSTSLSPSTNPFYTETHKVTLQYDDEGHKIVNDYLFLSTIGKGSYAKVKMCLNLKDNKHYAVKIINKNLLLRKKKGYGRDKEGNMSIIYMLEDALNEIDVLKRLNEQGGHKNVVKLYEVIYDDEKGKIFLILERCARGSIMDYNDRTGVFTINKHYIDGISEANYTEDVLKGFLKDLAEGIEYSKIHSKNIIHRDIKTDNVLIDEEGNCKFSDFNIATFIKGEDVFTKTEGNLYFYPPEFCVDKSKIFAGKPVDMWAIGVTIYAAAYKKLPFMPTTPSNIMELFKLIEKANIKFPKNYSKNFVEFLKRLLERDPVKRMTVKEMLVDKYLE